jgi:hypothetical protein
MSKIINLNAMRKGFDRRCREGCQFASKTHGKSCPVHGGQSKPLMTLEELAIENIEQAYKIRELEKKVNRMESKC